MPVVLYISLYGITRYLISNCPDKVSIFPKFSTPKLSLYLRMSQKNFFRTHAFHNSHYLSNRVFRWYTCKYMYMIFSYLHFHYFTISRCQYLFKQFLYAISHLSPQYPLAIFRCPYKMVSRIVNCMAQSFYAHLTYYTRLKKRCNPFLPVLPHGVSRVVLS